MTKAISRRLSKLENRVVPSKRDGPCVGDIIRQKLRRLYEIEGRQYVKTPRYDKTGMTIGQVIRHSCLLRRQLQDRDGAGAALAHQKQPG